ncbi:CDP-glycerol glycerophosphotransferase [Lachnospiraceae bacterium XPB1003]|nr:CDP-glycerol glycerophosphotransferase [Lachnospiraceae bacterium XPB1003]
MNNEFVRYLKKRLIKLALHVFWLFPIEDNKISLLNELSFTYGDSLKYFDRFIHSNKKNEFQVVFPVKKESESSEYEDDIIVRPMSMQYFRQLITSRVIITNAGGVSYLPKRKGQIIISTWHGGGPYKKTGTDVYKNPWYKKQAKMNSDNTDYILSSCKSFSEIEAPSMGYSINQIIPAGLPRNDVLFVNHDEINNKVRKALGISNDTKFVLFAPTFRSKGNEFSNMSVAKDYIELDTDRLIKGLEEKYGCKWACGVRLHPKLANIDMSSLNVVNCTSYPDMQELLCCADAVISDYSSLIWDYSFTYRPIFLYAPDIEMYEKERGFYMPSSEWPYPIAHDNDEMEKVIIEFDSESYIQRVKEHHKVADSYEKGTACNILLRLIEK